MEYISSDTSVWLDFVVIDCLDLPFKLPYIYLMNEDAVRDELLSPLGLGGNLLALGLVKTELTEEEFYLTEKYVGRFPKLSIYDCVALAIAKSRGISLMTGDGLLRKVALSEDVRVVGTIGILEQLYKGAYIAREKYVTCLRKLQQYNGGKVRLPWKELEKRICEAMEEVCEQV